MGLANSIKKQMLDKSFGSTNYSPPANVYIGLSSSAPTASGGNVTEPSEGSYARIEVNNSTGWNQATNANPTVKNNAGEITFPESTAAWLSGDELTHFVIYDSLSAGNLIGFGVLDNPRIVNSEGITVSFAPGELNINLNSG